MASLPIEIPVQRAAELIAQGGAGVLDVREPHEYAAGRIPGSVHIPLGELAVRAGELDPEGPLIVVCLAGVRSLHAAQKLRAAGYEAASLAGGMLAWHDGHRPMDPPDGVVSAH
ncbi:unannotated protein [freshwater metagenome]|uniref:Unannotated protein n=1 Tax=freshwater metagenome TaxID=449393 RepID=A0A6J7D2T5_9ZZZZ|nr:rhodanese-like domain-containing protein [Actinomycetota bacterium]